MQNGGGNIPIWIARLLLKALKKKKGEPETIEEKVAKEIDNYIQSRGIYLDKKQAQDLTRTLIDFYSKYPDLEEEYPPLKDPKHAAKFFLVLYSLLGPSEKLLKYAIKGYLHVPRQGKMFTHIVEDKIQENKPYHEILKATIDRLSDPLTLNTLLEKQRKGEEYPIQYLLFPTKHIIEQPLVSIRGKKEDHPLLKLFLHIDGHHIQDRKEIIELIQKLQKLEELEENGKVTREEVEEIAYKLRYHIERNKPIKQAIKEYLDPFLEKHGIKVKLPWEKEEEEKIAPKILAHAIREKLPSAAIRTAATINTLEEGKIDTPTAIAILHNTHSSTTAHGKGLYNLIHKTLQKYEEEITKGKEPSPPSKHIEQTLREALKLEEWETPEEKLNKAQQKMDPEWTLAKIKLGISIPSTKAAKATLNLLQNLRKIEQQKEDPIELDTKIELTAIAKPIQQKQPITTQDKIKTLNPQIWNKIIEETVKTLIIEAQQTGREEDIQLLEKTKQIVAEEMAKADPQKPYYKTITQILTKLQERLEKEHPPEETHWAVNTAQKILATLPLQTLPPEKAKTLLTEGYDPEEYDTAILIRGLHTMYKTLKQKKTKEERIDTILRTRTSLNALEAVKGGVERTLLAALQEKKPEEIHPKLLAKTMHETVKSITRRR